MKSRPAVHAEHLIRRYENRKLYDVQARRYVTLEGLAGLVAGGTEVRVVDLKTGEDITTVVLAQVVLEGIKQRTASIPHQVLSRLIRLANGKGGGMTEWLEAPDLAARARQEAERIVSGLVARGRLTLDEALSVRQEIAGSAQRLITETQASLQGRLRRLLESDQEAAVSPALRALKDRLAGFEAVLAPPRPPVRRRSRRKKS